MEKKHTLPSIEGAKSTIKDELKQAEKATKSKNSKTKQVETAKVANTATPVTINNEYTFLDRIKEKAKETTKSFPSTIKQAPTTINQKTGIGAGIQSLSTKFVTNTADEIVSDLPPFFRDMGFIKKTPELLDSLTSKATQFLVASEKNKPKDNKSKEENTNKNPEQSDITDRISNTIEFLKAITDNTSDIEDTLDSILANTPYGPKSNVPAPVVSAGASAAADATKSRLERMNNRAGSTIDNPPIGTPTDPITVEIKDNKPKIESKNDKDKDKGSLLGRLFKFLLKGLFAGLLKFGELLKTLLSKLFGELGLGKLLGVLAGKLGAGKLAEKASNLFDRGKGKGKADKPDLDLDKNRVKDKPKIESEPNKKSNNTPDIDKNNKSKIEPEKGKPGKSDLNLDKDNIDLDSSNKVAKETSSKVTKEASKQAEKQLAKTGGKQAAKTAAKIGGKFALKRGISTLLGGVGGTLGSIIPGAGTVAGAIGGAVLGEVVGEGLWQLGEYVYDKVAGDSEQESENAEKENASKIEEITKQELEKQEKKNPLGENTKPTSDKIEKTEEKPATENYVDTKIQEIQQQNTSESASSLLKENTSHIKTSSILTETQSQDNTGIVAQAINNPRAALPIQTDNAVKTRTKINEEKQKAAQVVAPNSITINNNSTNTNNNNSQTVIQMNDPQSRAINGSNTW